MYICMYACEYLYSCLMCISSIMNPSNTSLFTAQLVKSVLTLTATTNEPSIMK